MKIVLTGGNGFIGKPILQSLLNSGHQILCLSRKQNEMNNLDLIWHLCDLSIPESYQQIVTEFEPEALIHLAWDEIPNFNSTNSFKNLINSISLLEFIFRIKSCKKILISGSCFEVKNEIGKCKENLIGEVSDYFTWSKISILKYLMLMNQDSNVQIGWMRIFYAYGFNQKKSSLIPKIIESFSNGKSVLLRNPYNVIDLINVFDIAKAFTSAIENNFESGIFNIGNGVPIKVIDVIETIEKYILNSDNFTNEIRRSNKNLVEELNFYADITKTQKVLSWNPTISLIDYLAKSQE